MGQIIIRRNAGSKFIVELAGHDGNVGKIECIVSVSGNRKSDLARRRAALEKARKLAETFKAELSHAS